MLDKEDCQTLIIKLRERIKDDISRPARIEAAIAILHPCQAEEGVPIIKEIFEGPKFEMIEEILVRTILDWMVERQTEMRRATREILETLADGTPDDALADSLRSIATNILRIADPNDLWMFAHTTTSKSASYKFARQEGFEEGYQRALKVMEESKPQRGKLTKLDL